MIVTHEPFARNGVPADCRQAGRRRRLAEETLDGCKLAPGRDDLLVGDGHDRGTRCVDALGVDRVADPDRRGERRRAVLGFHREDRRRQAELARFRRRRPTCCRLRRTGSRTHPEPPELLDDLEHRRLLPFASVRVDGVDEHVGAARASSCAAASASSKSPRTSSTVAPSIRVWATLAPATAPSGVRTTAGMPARAAYAAADAAVFPVEAQITASASSSSCLRDRNGHPAILVRARRIGCLPFEPELDPEQLGEARRTQERSRPLAERDHRCPVADGEDWRDSGRSARGHGHALRPRVPRRPDPR